MASLDGISFDVTTRQITRTILSSVGGFSQSHRQHIRSLQDLLATIQRFNLDVFDSRTLQKDAHIGEGVSYRVSRCLHTRTNKLYARKEVKLPPKGSDTGAFERQIACVLRDVEVMYCLANRSNILDIFGYGWDIDSGSVIPFLVTEFAAEGTLRQFLRSSPLSVHEKLLFCKDVAQGLHSLHVAGIAHGDLKLDNVLVTPYVGNNFAHIDQEMLRTTGMEACISDFGHSLHLYDDEGDTNVKQRYGGTLAYNAPEILDKSKTTRADVNFRKCDVWSLGLLCWEVLIDGKAYYHTSDVEDSILSSQKRSRSLSASNSNVPSQASSSAMVEELANIAPQLAEISCKEVTERTSGKLTPREIQLLHFLFKKCLQPDPADRIADIPLLPFFHGQDIRTETSPAGPSRLQVAAGTSWSFELFRVADLIPNEVRKQIANDCQKIADEPGESILSARASFQLGLAYAAGFGVQDPAVAMRWFGKSIEKGFRLAWLYLPVLRTLDPSDPAEHRTCLQNYIKCNRSGFKAKFGSSLLTLEDPAAGFQESDLEQLDEATLALRGDHDKLDAAGDTSLTLVAKFGYTQMAHFLYSRGASANVTDSVGCSPLHWLFMFPDSDIDDIAARWTGERINFVFHSEHYESSKDWKIHVPFTINQMASVKTPLKLDPQLPLILGGTPLAFAVSVHCKPAVRALLRFGADPLLGQHLPGHEIQTMSPILIAFRLHMSEMLELLLESLLKQGLPLKAIVRILDDLQSFAPAPELERLLLHGKHTQFAMEQTFDVLREYYRYAGQEPRTWDFLKIAAPLCNLELCSAIIKVMSVEDAGLEQEELDELLYSTTVAACQGGRDVSISLKMLDFARGITSASGAETNLNCYPGTDKMPIFVIIDHRQPELLDWFLEQDGIDLSLVDDEGDTVLHRMITSGFSTSYSIQKLVQKGARPDQMNAKNQRPIELALDDKMVEVFKSLLDYCSARLWKDLLWTAIEADSPKIVLALLQYVRSMRRIRTLDLDECLHFATEMASGEIAELLINFGADIKKLTQRGLATIHLAALHGNIDILNICIKAGHDINDESGSGAPLLLAVTTLARGVHLSETGARACADALLEAGANVDCMDSDKRTPLAFLLEAHMYVRKRHTSLIETLLDKGANPNENQSPLVEYPLAKAIKEEDFDLAELLVKHNIDVDRHAKDGDYPLHLCARLSTELHIDEADQSRPARLAAKLLERGADFFSKNKGGYTPLEFAIYQQNGPVVMALIKRIWACRDFNEDVLQRTNGADGGNEKSFRKKFIKVVKPGSISIKKLSQQAEAVQEGWGLSVFSKSYTCMSAFLRTGMNGPTSYMTRRTALMLLGYAIYYELSDILIKFMGDTSTGEKPDEFLKAQWDSVRIYFPFRHSTSQLLSLPTMVGWVHEGRQILDPDDHRAMTEDEDVPPFLINYAHRFQYMSVIDTYSRIYPASYLAAKEYVEAQCCGGHIEAVVDQEEQNRRQQMVAMQSILAPADDEFTYDSGF